MSVTEHVHCQLSEMCAMNDTLNHAMDLSLPAVIRKKALKVEGIDIPPEKRHLPRVTAA